MKIRCFVAGLLVGVGGTAVGLSFADGVAGKDTPFCELVVNQDARLKELFPGMSHYTLRCRGRDVGLIAADENGIKSVLVVDESSEHNLAIYARDGVFPSYYSLSLCKPGKPEEPLVTIRDDDLDGIPDRRIDWLTNTRYTLADIKWKPCQKPQKKGR